jgi:hypothetical protein
MTITHYPPAYASVHDDLVFTVTDPHTADPATYPNYKFIADVYVNSVQVARLKKAPNPVTNVGVFDVSPVVRNYIQAVFKPTLNTVSFNLVVNEFYIDLQVKFGEEYSFTSFYNINNSANQSVYNNYNRQLFGTDSSLAAKVDLVASNMPLKQSVYSNQSFSFLSVFSFASTVDFSIHAQTGGTYSFGTSGPTSNNMFILNFAPLAINADAPGTIKPADSYYDVTVNGDKYRYYIICEPQYDIYELHFLNQYGGYDTKLFSKVSRTNVNIQRSSFGVLPYAVDSGGDVSYYSGQVYNETVHNYANQFTERLTLNSNFLTDAEYEWLYDLLVSTQVYIYYNGFFKSVTVTDNNYELKKRVNDNLTNLTITVEQGKTFNAQYR